MHKQLIITGFHRSGTSMLAQELHNAGLFLGDRLMKPDISNADGHYEDMDFFTFHEKILRSHHLNWQYASDESIDIPQLYKPDMHRIIQDRNKQHKQWGFKDPRVAFFMDEWYEQLDNPYTIVIYRHYEECVNSLLHRAAGSIAYNQSADISFWEDPALAYRMWLSYNKKIIAHVKKYPKTCFVVSQNAILEGFPVVQTVSEKFGFNLDLTAKSAIKKSLLSSMKFQHFTLDCGLLNELEETWQMLEELSLAPSNVDIQNSPSVKKSTLDSLDKKLEVLGISHKIDNGPIDIALETLSSNDMELEEKIAFIKKQRSLFSQFRKNELLIDSLRVLLRKYPEEAELYFLLSEICIVEKQYDAAELLLLKVFSVTKKIAPFYYWRLSNLYLKKNDLDAAEYYIDKAITANPLNPSFYATAGMIAYERCEYDAALSEFDKAIHINNENTYYPNAELNFQFKKIDILNELGKTEEVKSIFTYLDEKFPSDERVTKKHKNIFQIEEEIDAAGKIKELKNRFYLIQNDPYYYTKLISLWKNLDNDWAREDLLDRIVYHFRGFDTDNHMDCVCIIILGMHRSGTSCLMGSLEKLGLFSGDISTWNPYNLKGNREHFSIVALNEKILKFNDGDWDNPPDTMKWNDEHRVERDAIIDTFLQTQEPLVGFKDPRTVFTLPFWEEGFEKKMTVRYVGSFRNPESVVQSLIKRNAAMGTEAALLIWKKYNKKLLEYYDQLAFPLISFDKDEDAYKQDMIEISKELGLDPQILDGDFFYDSSLNNQKNTKDSLNDKEAFTIYQKLQQLSERTLLLKRKKKLTVIVNFYNMQREAKRTLFTLTEAYQNISSDLYDVIVIDNGSTKPLKKEFVESFGSNFFYLFYESKHPSPVEAINYCAKSVKSEFVMCLIDGARMLSPGILQYSFDAWKLADHPFVYTIGMHIGNQLQNILVEKGYDQEKEDKLISTIDWKSDGYTLFSISSVAASSKKGFYSFINESNCFSLRRMDFMEAGGYNEKFISPGAGLVNLDFFNKVNKKDTMTPVMLLGEASFHQFHGGVATNVPRKDHPFAKMQEEYYAIYGEQYEPYKRKPLYFGSIDMKYHEKLIVQT